MGGAALRRLTMDDGAREPWLPDLCRLQRLAIMFAVAELAVLVVALAPDGGREWSLARFVSASGFALWLALTMAVLLCALRTWLSRWSRPVGGLIAVLLSAWVTAIGALLLYAVDAALGYGLVPGGVTSGRFAWGTAAVAALIVAVVLRYLYAVDRWQAQVQASARAQADALQARIRPHFLFNSMNTIAGVLRRDPAVAERAVLDLSDLFRAALGAGEGDSTLAEEVALAERYLAIEQLRLGDRLRVEWERVEPLPWELPLPRLLLQPLVENAVLHGISRLPAGGTVRIGLVVEAGELRVSVRNPAPPPPPPGVPARRAGDGAGHAQRNIGDRLAFALPGAGMSSGWDAGEGGSYYLVELRVPLGKAPAPAGDAGRRKG